MERMTTRPAAVAGSWYPASAGALGREVDGYLDAAVPPPAGDIHAVIAPHAGIMFSGPVAACAYKAAATQAYDVAVLVGPSHFVGFDGVALYPEGAFATPFGPIAIDAPTGAAIAAADAIVHAAVGPHAREHSLEMQLPFLRRVLPDLPIVPLLMGQQTADTITRLAGALAAGVAGRRALLVASTDLSHYYDADTAAALDTQVHDRVEAFDAAGLLTLLRRSTGRGARSSRWLWHGAGDRRDDGGTNARRPRCAGPALRAFRPRLRRLHRCRRLPRGGVRSVPCSLSRSATRC